jgi:hypothetical protein
MEMAIQGFMTGPSSVDVAIGCQPEPAVFLSTPAASVRDRLNRVSVGASTRGVDARLNANA